MTSSWTLYYLAIVIYDFFLDPLLFCYLWYFDILIFDVFFLVPLLFRNYCFFCYFAIFLFSFSWTSAILLAPGLEWGMDGLGQGLHMARTRDNV